MDFKKIIEMILKIYDIKLLNIENNELKIIDLLNKEKFIYKTCHGKIILNIYDCNYTQKTIEYNDNFFNVIKNNYHDDKIVSNIGIKIDNDNYSIRILGDNNYLNYYLILKKYNDKNYLEIYKEVNDIKKLEFNLKYYNNNFNKRLDLINKIDKNTSLNIKFYDNNMYNVIEEKNDLLNENEYNDMIEKTIINNKKDINNVLSNIEKDIPELYNYIYENVDILKEFKNITLKGKKNFVSKILKRIR